MASFPCNIANICVTPIGILKLMLKTDNEMHHFKSFLCQKLDMMPKIHTSTPWRILDYIQVYFMCNHYAVQEKEEEAGVQQGWWQGDRVVPLFITGSRERRGGNPRASFRQGQEIMEIILKKKKQKGK